MEDRALEPIIQVKNLTHTYGAGTPFQRNAVDHMSFDVQEGEFLGIIGHTGSGKSTLIQHLNGLLQPTEGQILLHGKDIWAEPKKIRDVRFRVGLVFQYPEYQLFEETIAKDIAFGPKNQGLSEEEIDQRVRRAMAHVHLDYDKYAERSPFDLSGGQMRRVAIAGVLAMEPKVLILDEPAAGLDPRGRERILGMLQELHREGGVTIVMVSHSMDDCARLATRMIVMSKGELVLTDTPRNVFRQADLMRSIGLGVPEAAELCGRLRAAGLQLPDDLFTQEELHDHLLRLWKEKQEKEAAK